MSSSISSLSTVTSVSNTTSDSASSAAATSKEDFLKLLTYQLKNQNPLDPYDNQEFSSTLAQFSQLEQLTNISSLLEEQSTTNQELSKTMSNSALPGLLGKTAKALTNEFQFDGTNTVQLGYQLSSSAKSGTVTIYNDSGKAVRTYDLSSLDLTTGEHSIVWNGKDDDGNALSSGDYKFKIEAYNTDGTAASAEKYVYGTIQSVRFKSEGSFLVINGKEVALENVKDVTTTN